ncbi:MAG TPA: hypothetical protein IAC03_02035 [Candidatus Coprenecus pullistercoris]|nr:hypothetical protein [Candidatus Coprenecus pullistercoris]
MKRPVLKNIMGGQTVKSLITKQWKLIFYIFLLLLLYITFKFGARGTKITLTANEDTLRNLRSEYLSKYTLLLRTGKRGEIERLLEDNGIELLPPQTPPQRIDSEDM